MDLRNVVRHLPQRIATGAFVLHSGLEKWSGDEDTANGIHGMATGAYPFLGKVKPATFLKALSIGEITTGVLLLIPFVPRAVAGAALTAFSGGLVTLYARTPALHQPGSVWPTPAGLGVSKDIWMLGIGTGLILDSAITPSRD